MLNGRKVDLSLGIIEQNLYSHRFRDEIINCKFAFLKQACKK
jgi:hypothetical protein